MCIIQLCAEENEEVYQLSIDKQLKKNVYHSVVCRGK